MEHDAAMSDMQAHLATAQQQQQQQAEEMRVLLGRVREAEGRVEGLVEEVEEGRGLAREAVRQAEEWQGMAAALQREVCFVCGVWGVLWGGGCRLRVVWVGVGYVLYVCLCMYT